MKILYFHQHFNTPKGSVGIRSYELSRRMVKAGHEVTIVCGSYGTGNTGLTNTFQRGRREGAVEGIRVIEFDLEYSNSDSYLKRTWTFINFALKSIVLVFTEKYDVVFATTTPLTAGIPGILARWLRKKIFVFEVRDLWPELPKEMGVIKNPVVLKLLSFLEWASYRSADRCIGLSPGIVEGIAKRGVERSNIKLIPNGCDLGIFGGDIEIWRPEGVMEGDFTVIYTGTHGIANGLDNVLDVAKELKKRGRNDIKFVFVGQGKLKPQLEQRAKQEQLNNIVFCPPVDKKRLAGLMEFADLGLQVLANIPAFYYGTSPNKFFDYISAGLPVLNNYPGWLAEMIDKNECGYVVAAKNPSVFADTLEDAVEDKNKGYLQYMGENSRRLAEQSFNRDQLADEWIDWVTGATR